jgi:hypothetical protein
VNSTLQTLLDNSVVMMVLIFFTAWTIGHIVEEVRKYACHRKDVELKRELVDRGLSADEIERIIAASAAPMRKSKAKHSAPEELQQRPPTSISPKETTHVHA